MSDLTLDIIPKKGLGQIHFGEVSENIIKLIGQPEDLENITDVDEFHTVILYYWNKGLTLFFEGQEKSVVSCIETENTDCTMFGEKIFELKEKDIVALMKSKGYEVAEVENEITGEKRVSYDDAMIDFFFEKGALVAVNWECW